MLRLLEGSRHERYVGPELHVARRRPRIPRMLRKSLINGFFCVRIGCASLSIREFARFRMTTLAKLCGRSAEITQ